jgi:hypothetical protein
MSLSHKVLFIIFLFGSATACQNDDALSFCPALQPCAIDDNNEVVILNPDSLEFQDYNIGSCRAGEISCMGGELLCNGYIKPSEEICDGIDNNCDDQIDEGYDVDEDSFTSCNGDCDDNNNLIYPGAPEICDYLDNDCNGGIPRDEYDSDGDDYAPCDNDCDDTNHRVNPAATEICDGIDNDCDGEIDETEPTFETCGPPTAAGICEYGTLECVDGAESICVNAVYPQNEICNNLDDDCDGTRDNDLFRPCSTICGSGVEICFQGSWYDCTAPEPEEESCDDIDNDCDGFVDEDCDCTLGDIIGCAESPMLDPLTEELIDPPCGIGIKICDETGQYGPCYFFDVVPEECNGWDDDCDGVVDGQTELCSNDPTTAGIGECTPGTKVCEDAEWSPCDGQIFPQEEVCDGLDNDCDGETDEDLDPHEKADLLFVIDVSGSMQGYINALASALAAYVTDFQQTEHRFGLVTFPKSMLPISGYEYFVASGNQSSALISVTAFQNLVGSLLVESYGDEPSLDVARILMDSQDPAQINWRADAYPYVIIITDEPPQTWSNNTIFNVAFNSLNCQIASCEPGDMYEFYVIGKPMHQYLWQPALPSPENYKFLPYQSDGSATYIEILREIFKNACL